MFRPALRTAFGPSSTLRVLPRSSAAKRFLSTAPPHQRSRGWRNSAIRWGLAGALIYYYNTTTVFAEEPAYVHAPPESSRENETYETVASVSERRRNQSQKQRSAQQEDQRTYSETVVAAADGETTASGSPEALEEEASQQGAFNEETGEINWDCPCLGGMAHGPCGEQFRAAFSCFVFSKEDPKGVDCIEHFKTMQNCFREHPEVYGSELEDDDAPADYADGDEPPASEPQSAATSQDKETPSNSDQSTAQTHARSQKAADQVKKDHPATSETAEAVPKAWHDTREAKTDK